MKLWIISCIVLLTTVIKSEDTQLTIVHFNDLHAHLDQISETNGRCRKTDTHCVAGISRMYSKIKEIHENEERVMIFNAGDLFQGTIWYSSPLKHKVLAQTSKLLNLTAMTLGNHEFDDNIGGLSPFMTESRSHYDILSCNLDTTLTPGITPKKYIIKDVNGIKIGIIGYITSSSQDIIYNTDGKVKVFEEVEAVQKTATMLKSRNVDVIIGLGHSGFKKDVEIASKVPEIDLVVGGHSHTFLYPTNSTHPSIEEPEENYPFYVTQSSGKIVPVVQAFYMGKYLGKLDVKVGELGLTVDKAEVIYLDNNVPQDPEIESLLDGYRQNELKEYYSHLGDTQVPLLRNWTGESNLADLIADSMVDVYNNDVDFGFIHNRAIRADVTPGDLTAEDVISILPFNTTVDRAQITGKDLKMILENYASDFCPTCDYRRFFQISKSLRIVYDIFPNNVGRRVKSIKIKCDSNWCPISNDKTYNIALTYYLATNSKGEGASFKELITNHVIGSFTDAEALIKYIRKSTPITIQRENRITINLDESSGTNNKSSSMVMINFIFTLIFIKFIL